jgi:hypothetical protein
MENMVTQSANTGGLFRSDDAADYLYNVGIKHVVKMPAGSPSARPMLGLAVTSSSPSSSAKPVSSQEKLLTPGWGSRRPLPFFLALFTEVPGRGILRGPYAVRVQAPVLPRSRPLLTLRTQNSNHDTSRTRMKMRSGAYAPSRQDTDYAGAGGWSGVTTPGPRREVRPA